LSIEPQEDHQLIHLSENFQIAHQAVDYLRYERLKKKIESSVFSLSDYFYSMSNRNRQIEWLSIRSLLLDMGVKSDIFYDTHGKPHLYEGAKHLSISHSKKSIAVSLHQEQEHGIDLQYITPKIINIKNKFLTQEELSMLNDENDPITLTVLWSMKEALFKSYGKKDIFLKEHIRLSELGMAKDQYVALGKIRGIEREIKYPMRARMLEDYILAYTLIP